MFVVNYSFGLGFEVDDFDFGFVDIDVDEIDGFGFFVDFCINNNLMVEVLYLMQEIEFEVDEGFFLEFFFIVDVDIEYLYVGVFFEVFFG